MGKIRAFSYILMSGFSLAFALALAGCNDCNGKGCSAAAQTNRDINKAIKKGDDRAKKVDKKCAELEKKVQDLSTKIQTADPKDQPDMQKKLQALQDELAQCQGDAKDAHAAVDKIKEQRKEADKQDILKSAELLGGPVDKNENGQAAAGLTAAAQDAKDIADATKQMEPKDLEAFKSLPAADQVEVARDIIGNNAMPHARISAAVSNQPPTQAPPQSQPQSQPQPQGPPAPQPVVDDVTPVINEKISAIEERMKHLNKTDENGITPAWEAAQDELKTLREQRNTIRNQTTSTTTNTQDTGSTVPAPQTAVEQNPSAVVEPQLLSPQDLNQSISFYEKQLKGSPKGSPSAVQAQKQLDILDAVQSQRKNFPNGDF